MSANDKPRFRGVSHLVAACVALIAACVLVRLAPSLRARVAGGIYSFSLAVMFGVSALYHMPTWQPRVRAWLRRLDHATIFLFIAASYTPFCVLTLRDGPGSKLLTLAWIGAGLGILQALFWIRAPRVLSASIYIALGWMLLPYARPLVASIGVSGMGLMLAGGLCFTAGAVIYALRRPNPLPAVFGYHEIFHALVIAGCTLQYVVIAPVVCGGG